MQDAEEESGACQLVRLRLKLGGKSGLDEPNTAVVRPGQQQQVISSSSGSYPYPFSIQRGKSEKTKRLGTTSSEHQLLQAHLAPPLAANSSDAFVHQHHWHHHRTAVQQQQQQKRVLPTKMAGLPP